VANARHNAFNRLQRCYEPNDKVVDAFFDLADANITVRSLVRQAWTTYRWDITACTSTMFTTPIQAAYCTARSRANRMGCLR
jgi:hypothetical protein